MHPIVVSVVVAGGKKLDVGRYVDRAIAEAVAVRGHAGAAAGRGRRRPR